ncbi:MAG: ABC transporter substrate-binding protein, partial [Pseudomonadota bacterium]
LDPVPKDAGLAGARLGIADNASTGGFLGHNYSLEVAEVELGADPMPVVEQALADGFRLFVIDAPAEALAPIVAAVGAAGGLGFNATAPDMTLRNAACHPALLHTGLSRQMKTDALAQFLLTRRWSDVAMIVGPNDGDAAWADAFRASARKFGLDIVGERGWDFDADMRRNAATEVPVFTQELGDYDALVVADEADDFARYIPFNTWDARPVVGHAGLRAEGWDRVVEQWGAAQLQSRFDDLAGRPMRSDDYGAWAAVRAIGEAVTRTNSGEAADLRAFLLGDGFTLAAFKGRPLSFRGWNGQLRQPVPLVHPRALAALAPLEGFLHETNPLDSLGLDQGDSACTAFGEN